MVGANDTEDDRGSCLSVVATGSLSDTGHTMSALPVLRRLARHSAGASSTRLDAGCTATLAADGTGSLDIVVAGCRPITASLVGLAELGGDFSAEEYDPPFSRAISSSETDFSDVSVRVGFETLLSTDTLFSLSLVVPRPFTIGG